MTWGKYPADFIANLMESDDKAAIAQYQDRTTVPDTLTFFWNAFWDLHNYEGVSYSELDLYASRCGIDDPDEFDRFKTIARALNNAWSEIINEKPDASDDDSDDEPSKPKPKARVIGG